MPHALSRYGVLLFPVLLATAVVATQPGQVRLMRANGTDLPYVEQGGGTPVVFVHGAVGDLRFWEPQRSAFSKQHRFVAYTLRFHGTRPWADDGKLYTADTHAADLEAFVAGIAGLKGGPAHLVGLSYGGLLAAMAAVKAPRQIRTLTLAEPALFSLLGERPDGLPVLERWSQASEPMIAALKANDNAGAIRLLAALVAGGGPDHFDTLPAPFRQILSDNARTLPLLFNAPPPAVTCDMLRGVKVPTLIVRGERTPEFFSKINEAVAACIAGSTSAVVPKASHASSFDNPAEFNRVVLGFLATKS
jgi:pimeloyl-ACP methyl ester carboxylesterase